MILQRSISKTSGRRRHERENASLPQLPAPGFRSRSILFWGWGVGSSKLCWPSGNFCFPCFPGSEARGAVCRQYFSKQQCRSGALERPPRHCYMVWAVFKLPVRERSRHSGYLRFRRSRPRSRHWPYSICQPYLGK